MDEELQQQEVDVEVTEGEPIEEAPPEQENF